MTIKNAIKDYIEYLVIEKNLSENTVEAYERDLNKFMLFIGNSKLNVSH